MESFTPEVVFATSARRVSERKRVSTQVDKTFFKKTYKPKTSRMPTKPHSELATKGEVLIVQENTKLSEAANVLFPTLLQNRRQAKAIQTFRAKKVKRLFAAEAGIEEMIARYKSEGLNLHMLLSLKRSVPNGKALFAASRCRDTMGRFNSDAGCSKHQSSQESTVDQREDCSTELNCSIFGLLSLDGAAFDAARPAQHAFDFDRFFESSHREREVLGASLLCQTPNQIPDGRARLKENLAVSHPAKLREDQYDCWKSAGIEDPEAHFHLCSDLSSEDLDQGLTAFEELFGES